jgi:hypothetical protein
MKYSIAAVVALSAAPSAYCFSYLDSLSSGTRVASSVDIAPPVPAHPAAPQTSEAPFFFTNGAQDEPADSPAFFFTNGASDAPAAPTTGSYLDNLGGGASAPTGGSAGTGSYLDYLGSGTTSVSGPGMTSYLDALPRNSATGGGPGISSYASSLNQAAAAYQAAAAAPVEVPMAAAPVEAQSFDAAPSAPASGNYLDALSTGNSISGPGLTSYLDALPRSSSRVGGAGITTYVSNIIAANVVSGPGLVSYTDALSGRSYFSKSFSPFGGSSPARSGAPSFAIGSTTGRFDFTLEADAETIEQLKAAAGRRVTLRGRITSW